MCGGSDATGAAEDYEFPVILREKMRRTMRWPFRKKAETAPEPIPVAVAADPHEETLSRFREVERKLDDLNASYLALHRKFFGFGKWQCMKVQSYAERERVLAEERRIFQERDRLAPVRNRLLQEMARYKTGVQL